ncbi:TPA: TraK family protein [Legionella pneumophila]|uniref:TraK family protein n=1 Tax=Legionella pneumophila TaxID=446 RepID=UPI001A2FCB96|nr:TraK family protein [Legionella pneumophila]HAT7922405.1 conjugal transfer protein TraK [Legionella pneumophila]HAT8309780.1 conjugal transfer protein TraK [Legionella pneumophila]HAU1061780.1 conjugal transfer protein TraK [Legionella pneumophila]HAU1200919.1 conjugal transfer protein TraK [Legionella pneumophila]
MNKSLTENLKSSNQAQQRANARKHKVEFLSLREDISKALEKGWSVTIIWETLGDEGSFTAIYNTFRLYVLKYLSGQKSGYSPKESVAVRTTKSVENQSSKQKDISKPSFSYNPINNIKGLL